MTTRVSPAGGFLAAAAAAASTRTSGSSVSISKLDEVGQSATCAHLVPIQIRFGRVRVGVRSVRSVRFICVETGSAVVVHMRQVTGALPRACRLVLPMALTHIVEALDGLDN